MPLQPRVGPIPLTQNLHDTMVAAHKRFESGEAQLSVIAKDLGIGSHALTKRLNTIYAITGIRSIGVLLYKTKEVYQKLISP